MMFDLRDLESGYLNTACFEQPGRQGAYRIDDYLLPVESADNNEGSSLFEELFVMQQQRYQPVSGHCIALDYRLDFLVAKQDAQVEIDQLEDLEVEAQAMGILDEQISL